MKNEDGVILFMSLLFFTIIPVTVFFLVRDSTKSQPKDPPTDNTKPPVNPPTQSGYSSGYSGYSAGTSTTAGTDCGLYYPTLPQAQSGSIASPPGPPPPPSYWTPYFVNYYA